MVVILVFPLLRRVVSGLDHCPNCSDEDTSVQYYRFNCTVQYLAQCMYGNTVHLKYSNYKMNSDHTTDTVQNVPFSRRTRVGLEKKAPTAPCLSVPHQSHALHGCWDPANLLGVESMLPEQLSDKIQNQSVIFLPKVLPLLMGTVMAHEFHMIL